MASHPNEIDIFLDWYIINVFLVIQGFIKQNLYYLYHLYRL